MKISARTLSLFLLVAAFFTHAYSPTMVLVDATDPAKYDTNDGSVAMTNIGPQYTIVFRNPGVNVQSNVTTDINGLWQSSSVPIKRSCEAPTSDDDYLFALDDNFSVKSCTQTGPNTLNPHYSLGANSSYVQDNTTGQGNIVIWLQTIKPLSAGLYGGQHLLYKQRFCLLHKNCSTTSFDAKDENGNYLVQGEVDVWLNYSIIIPTSCTINSGTLVKVDLPPVSSGILKAAGVGGASDALPTKNVQIPIHCTGDGSGSANMELRLGGPTPIGLPGALSSNIPGVGIAVRDENPSSVNYGQDLKANTSDSYVSLTSDSNGSSTATLSFRPVYTGGDLYPGNYIANGILVANIP